MKLPKIDKSIGSRIFSPVELELLGYKRDDKRNKLICLNLHGTNIVINKLVMNEKISPHTICEKLEFQLVDEDGKPIKK